MSKQVIGTGAAANDGTGDTIRAAFTKCNANFDELYARTPVPNGGATGKLLAKASAADGDVAWVDAPSGGGSSLPAGGTTGQVLTKNSATDGDAGWATPSSGGGGGGGSGSSTTTNRNISLRAPASAQFSDHSVYGRGSSSTPLTIVDDGANGLVMTDPTSDTTGWKTALRAIPSGATSFEVAAKIEVAHVNSRDHLFGVLCFADAAGHVQFFGFAIESGVASWTDDYQGSGGWADNHYTVYADRQPWVKMSFDASGNLHFYIGNDGVNWQEIYAGQTLAAHGIGTPVKYGFAMHRYTNGTGIVSIPYFYSTEFPAPTEAPIAGSSGGGGSGGTGEAAFVAPATVAGGSWTQQNFDSSYTHFEDDTVGGVPLVRLRDGPHAYGNSNILRAALKPIPGTHWQLTARLRRLSPLVSYTTLGLVFRDSASGNSVIIGIGGVNGVGLTVLRLNGDGSYNANQDLLDRQDQWRDLWLRVKWDGTSCILYASNGGGYFTQVVVFADSKFSFLSHAATHGGFGFSVNNNGNNSVEFGLECLSFDFEPLA